MQPGSKHSESASFITCFACCRHHFDFDYFAYCWTAITDHYYGCGASFPFWSYYCLENDYFQAAATTNDYGSVASHSPRSRPSPRQSIAATDSIATVKSADPTTTTTITDRKGATAYCCCLSIAGLARVWWFWGRQIRRETWRFARFCPWRAPGSSHWPFREYCRT